MWCSKLAGTPQLCDGSLDGGGSEVREPVKCCLRVFSYLAWTLEFLSRDCLFGTRVQQKIVLGLFS